MKSNRDRGRQKKCVMKEAKNITDPCTTKQDLVLTR